jgi:hypothetical protein
MNNGFSRRFAALKTLVVLNAVNFGCGLGVIYVVWLGVLVGVGFLFC